MHYSAPSFKLVWTDVDCYFESLNLVTNKKNISLINMLVCSIYVYTDLTLPFPVDTFVIFFWPY